MLIDRSVLITVTLLLAAISTGVLIFSYLRHRRTEREREQQRAASSAHVIATQSLEALRGLPQRLAILDNSATDTAAGSRQCASQGLQPGPSSVDTSSWKAPEELWPGSQRAGDPQRWQAVDRAIWHLVAVLDHPTLEFDAHAGAYEQLAGAARALAAEVSETPRPHGRAQCWFCGQTAEQVRRLIAGTHASICDQCVELCNEVLD